MSVPGAPSSIPRVLHVHFNADVYGASRMLLRWLRKIDRQRFDPIVVLGERGPLEEFLRKEGVEVIQHPGLSILARAELGSWRVFFFGFKYILSVLFLLRLIRRQRIALVYTNTGVILSAALAARIAGVPHVWHIREWFQEFRWLWKPFQWYILRFSSRVIAISNAVAAQFRPDSRIVTIHDSFSLADEPPGAPDEKLRNEFRDRYQLADHFVVGCVGRIKFVRKGQETLVSATAELKKRGIPIRALIVGAPFTGNEAHLHRLKTLARELNVENEVVFAGEMIDPRPAFAAMDVFALTSIQPEPFGGVVSEAMSIGLPVIATNVGGSLDQVLDGETGFLVPPGNAIALADSIERLKSDPELRQRMGSAALARVESHFALPVMARKIEAVLEDALSDAKE